MKPQFITSMARFNTLLSIGEPAYISSRSDEKSVDVTRSWASSICRAVGTSTHTVTRSRTLGTPTDVGAQIHVIARDLLDTLVPVAVPIRLVGVRAEGLVPATARQLSFDDVTDVRREAEVAVDGLRARFGPDVVRAARLLREGESGRSATPAPP